MLAVISFQRSVSSFSVHSVIYRRWSDGPSGPSMSAYSAVLGVVSDCYHAGAEMFGNGHCECAVPAAATRTAGVGREADSSLPVTPR